LLKNGKFPLLKALKYNLKIGLGTDSLASNYSLDMFKEIRQLKGNIRSELINERLIELVTLGGARVLGLENEAGSLTPGKKADIIAVKIKRPSKRFSPLNYIVSEITSEDVSFTMIDGIIKYDIMNK
jgi:5-methylthioadenosine/S-adenosylhomocysteine deaminase